MNAYFSRIATRLVMLVAVVLVAAIGARAQSTVVVFDGFGDGDRNNNGTPFEDDDTNISEPPAVVGDGDSTTYTPERVIDGAGMGPVNNEVTSLLAPEDADDVGIRWFGIRGFTNSPGGQTFPGFGAPSPTLRIVNDTQGAMLETQPVSNPGGLGRNAIDSGYALSLEQRGRGALGAGFFGQNVALGSDIGDELTVSFDFRIWGDTPREETFSPNFGNIRFGLYQDTDMQLGQINPAAGRSIDANMDGMETAVDQLTPVPAQWGFEDGEFGGNLNSFFGAGSEIGAAGDAGWSTELAVGDNIPGLFDDGITARIRNEFVQNGDEILQGQDVETIATGQGLVPAFGDLTDTDAIYNIGLTLRRVEVDIEIPVEGGAPDETEIVTVSSIASTLFHTNRTTGVTEQLIDDGTDPDLFGEDLVTIRSPDNFDYFVIRGFGQTTGDEFDFLIDNFTVSVTGLDALQGDFNGDGTVDAADYTVWRDNLGADESALGGAGDGSGMVDVADYNLWVANFGQSLATAAAGAAPEPSGLLLVACCVCLLGHRRAAATSKRN